MSSLTCLVDSSPPASLSWTRDGVEVRRLESRLRSVLDTLEVRSREEGWLGNYSCSATSNNISQSQTLQLTGLTQERCERDINLLTAGCPLAPLVTSRSMSAWPRQHQLSWKCESVSGLLEYEIAYKNKWSKVRINLISPESSGIFFTLLQRAFN